MTVFDLSTKQAKVSSSSLLGEWNGDLYIFDDWQGYTEVDLSATNTVTWAQKL